MMKHLFYSILVVVAFTVGCSSESEQNSENTDGQVQDSNSGDVNSEEASNSSDNANEGNSEDQPSIPDLAPGEYVKVSTYYGDMYIKLYDSTPLHKENFLKLVKEGYYNGTTFHRVMDDFMVQGGDPNSKNDNTKDDGQGGPGYTIPAEIVDSLKHIRGAVAAARTGGPSNPEKRSSGSQFYVVENHEGTPFLDGEYTVFGQVVKGLDVPDKICLQKTGEGDRPIYDIKMTAEIVVIPEN